MQDPRRDGLRGIDDEMFQLIEVDAVPEDDLACRDGGSTMPATIASDYGSLPTCCGVGVKDGTAKRS
jgi:hypothetical protein